MHLDRVVGRDHGRKSQPDAKFAELNRNRARIGATLQYGHREFSADQKIGFLSVGGDQIRLSQDLENVLALQRLDEGPQGQLRIEGENV